VRRGISKVWPAGAGGVRGAGRGSGRAPPPPRLQQRRHTLNTPSPPLPNPCLTAPCILLNHPSPTPTPPAHLQARKPRELLFLVTKIHPRHHGDKAARAAFERTLKELGTSYVDLLLIHYPRCIPDVNHCKESEQEVRRGAGRLGWGGAQGRSGAADGTVLQRPRTEPGPRPRAAAAAGPLQPPPPPQATPPRAPRAPTSKPPGQVGGDVDRDGGDLQRGQGARAGRV
jgi:hypothetical protein